RFRGLRERPSLPAVQGGDAPEALLVQPRRGVGRGENVERLLFEDLSPVQRSKDRERLAGESRRHPIRFGREPGRISQQRKKVRREPLIEPAVDPGTPGDLDGPPPAVTNS